MATYAKKSVGGKELPKIKKQTKKKKRESYNSYIYKVLKDVGRKDNIGISKKAMDILDNFVDDMFERLAQEAGKLCKMRHANTLSSREVQTAVRLVLPGDLARHAVSEGTKAVAEFNRQAIAGRDAPQRRTIRRADSPAQEEIAEELMAEGLVAEDADEPMDEIAEELVDEPTAEEPIVAEEPATEEPIAEVTEQPVVEEEAVAEKPVETEPVVEAAEAPVAPVTEEPIAQEPVVEETATTVAEESTLEMDI